MISPRPTISIASCGFGNSPNGAVQQTYPLALSTFPASAASKQQKCTLVPLMRVSTISLVLMTVLAAALPHAAPAAQQPANDNPGAAGATSAQQVVLPVLARDKHGAPVASLAAGDLTLTEDGRRQTIQSLAQGTNSPLQLGLLVDTSRGMIRAMDSERKAAQSFVDLTLAAAAKPAGTPNQAFLIHFDREVELLEDFTDSRDKLHDALQDLGPTHASPNTQGPETTDSDGGRPNLHSTGPELYDAIYLAANELMKSRHGRKALIVFSNGVDAGSKESLDQAVEAAERAGTPIYTIYFKGDEERAEGGFPGGRRRGGIGGGWPGSGGGWPGGGNPGGRGSPRMPQLDGRKVMEQIATRSGGLYFEARKTAEFDGIYSQIARDLEGEYLLSYTPVRSSNDSGFHKVVLATTKADVTLTAPEGYYSSQTDSK